jgi:hypothetical protein
MFGFDTVFISVKGRRGLDRMGNEMKDKKYYTVGTVLKSNRKTKFTTLSEQF